MIRTLAVLCLLATPMTFTLGKPVKLVPGQSASGGGLTLRLEGYGHKIDMDGRDLAYVAIQLKAGTEETSMRFFREPTPEPLQWGGYEVRMTACEDQGPPHSSTAASTFVVVRVKQRPE